MVIWNRSDLRPADKSNAHASVGASQWNAKVGDIMQCGVVSVEPEESVHEAIGILVEKHLSGLPVVDHGELVGIVSEKDILRTLFDTHATANLVNDIMTEAVVSFSHTDSIFDICHCLMDNEFRRVPILNHGRLVGIVSRADIMMYIMKNRSIVSRDMA